MPKRWKIAWNYGNSPFKQARFKQANMAWAPRVHDKPKQIFLTRDGSSDYRHFVF